MTDADDRARNFVVAACFSMREMSSGQSQKTTQKIIDEILRKPQIIRRELSEVIGLTEEGIKYHLTKMQNMGQIRRVGPDKGGHWEIVGKWVLFGCEKYLAI